MSRFSHALSTALHSSGVSQGDLAAACCIHPGSISRYCAGRIRPDADYLTAICTTLPHYADALAIAYLLDILPADHAARLEARLAEFPPAPPSARVREPAPEHTPPSLDVIRRLQPSTRRALLVLAQAALDDPDAAAAIESTARYLSRS
jgi:transcriptional regulator with XRE-family HTH domain